MNILPLQSRSIITFIDVFSTFPKKFAEVFKSEAQENRWTNEH